MLQLDELQAMVPIVDKDGRPTPQFQKFWQALVAHVKDIEQRLEAAGIP